MEDTVACVRIPKVPGDGLCNKERDPPNTERGLGYWVFWSLEPYGIQWTRELKSGRRPYCGRSPGACVTSDPKPCDTGAVEELKLTSLGEGCRLLNLAV